MSEQIDSAIRWGTERIRGHSESARLDAELLLAFCLGKPRSYLYTWPEEKLSESSWQAYRALIEERLAPTPVAYLLGNREFYSREYATTPAALVPRAETEVLVELALAEIPEDRDWRICELGTGSGIIAITLKAHRPLARIVATDVDPACLELARANAQRHEVEIEFIESDWYRDLPPESRFDLIVSNPPYVAAGHPFLAEGDLPAEPEHALTPGVSGLEALEVIIGQAPGFLRRPGCIIVEHGYDQQSPVAELLRAQGFTDIRCECDLNDLPRATLARLA